MIRTSVIPCLSSGLTKNERIMAMFFLFSRLFGHFEGLAFFQNGGGGGGDKPYTKTVKQDVLSRLFKDTTIEQQFFKNHGYFD